MARHEPMPAPRVQGAPERRKGFAGSRLVRVLRNATGARRRRDAATQELDDSARARLGQVLCGKYRLERVLGVGGMATVYAATHRNRRQFAVKVLHPDLSLHPAIRARFQREGYITNSVGHHGAVAVLDDDVAEDGSAFLVMELLDGVSIDELWRQGERPLPVSAALVIGDQLLEVLSAAHAKGIVHRDLKPANLFLTREGALKVLDFGVARLHDTQAGGATKTGTTLGTPAFMAPEQAFGKASQLDEKADLWAVAATLFALISGELVHEGDDQQQLVARLAARSVRSLAEVAPSTPLAVVRVIDRALAHDKRERWPSAAAMREALQRAHSEAFSAPLPGGASALTELLAAHARGARSLRSADAVRASRVARSILIASAVLFALSVGVALWGWWLEQDAGRSGSPLPSGASGAKHSFSP